MRVGHGKRSGSAGARRAPYFMIAAGTIQPRVAGVGSGTVAGASASGG
jgi:hypothetical protein